MKELDVALKAVVDGLRKIAQGVENLAGKLEKVAPKKQAKAKPARKAKTKPAPKAKAVPKGKKVPAKKAPAKKAVKETASDTVLNAITGSKNGVSSADLAEKTGFDKKKLANIVFKLSKQGKIKSVSRGVYTKA